MSGIVHFEAFLIAGILLNLTPGNDTIFILTKSIGQGKRAGIVSALGIGTGTVVHTVLAALGLSLVIAKSMLLFNIIKFAGAAYLIYLGLKMIANKTVMETDNLKGGGSGEYLKIYRDAILTNVLNPKVALFFMAFLPQFIDPLLENTALPFFILGLTFIVTGTFWCLILAIFASGIFARLRSDGRVSGYVSKICGFALIGLAFKVAFTNRR